LILVHFPTSIKIANNIFQVNPKLLQRHINETLLPSLSLKKKTVSIRHCQRWLWRLGYRCKRHQKGVYWDGHERKDVKRRRKEYLAELHAFEGFRATYAEPDMAEVHPELADDEVEHIVIVHDEASFHSNDYQNAHYWLKPGEQVLKKKGRGRLIMVSAFLCERYGLLALTNEMIAENQKLAAELRLSITDSTKVIYPDSKAGGDAYWNMEQMIAQVHDFGFSCYTNLNIISSSLLSSLLVTCFRRRSFIGCSTIHLPTEASQKMLSPQPK
jgi:hypothetical protein